MGWRIDFYKANENEPLILTTEEDGYVSVKVNGERILDDIATDVWCELKQEEEFRKEIVCLHEHPDCDFYSITKKGFEMIILECRKKIINWMKCIIKAENNEKHKGCLMGEWEMELRRWESEWENPKQERLSYSEIDLSNNKWKVSGSWSYKYGIFDLIHVYKIFDWENDMMVVYGG